MARLLVMLLAAGTLGAADAPPPTPKHPVTDDYHGVKVVDDYRWLENWDDPAVRAWSDAENAYARHYLDALPTRTALEAELQRLLANPSPRYRSLDARHGKLFALKTLPPKEQPFLAVLDSPDHPASARTIVDPAAVDPTGHTAIDFYVPSPDGRFVAVSLSQGGSESGDLHVYETATGKALADVVPRVNGGTAGGAVAWNADASGFYYTRYPRSGERPPADLDFYQQVWFHKLGAHEDSYSLGKDFPRIAEITLDSSQDGRYVLARMSNGDGGEYAHYLLGPNGQWTQVARLADQVEAIVFGNDGFLYLLSRQNAPMGKILKLPLERPELAQARTVVPESGVAIEDFVPVGTRLFVADLVGGPSEIRIFDTNGKAQGTVPLEPISAVNQMLRYNGQLLYQTVSYVHPPAWQRFDPAAGKAAATALVELRRPISATPKWSATSPSRRTELRSRSTFCGARARAWMATTPPCSTGTAAITSALLPISCPTCGRCWSAVRCTRWPTCAAAGNTGDAWHLAGNLTHKQNVFDDFAACARHLIDQHYTSPNGWRSRAAATADC